MSQNSLSDMISIALGDFPAALVIKNTRVFHLSTGEFETADIAITADGRIAGVGAGYSGEREIDGSGLTAVPGFIDAHVHLESSLMTPREYEKCVIRHGVTTAVCDPHEMANVVGDAAFTYYLDCAGKMTMGLEVRMSSCVPATHLETAGAEVTARQLVEWHGRHPQTGLGELMNVPGVLFKDPEVLAKVSAFDFIDGHCPLSGGRQLNAYAAVGVRNCHESSSLAEAQEKIRRGMQVFIREGGAARNLDALIPLITVANSPFLAFCTDDRNPLDMQKYGHIDTMIRRAIAAGAEPLAVYRAASCSAARGLGLADRGLIAPGQRADIVLLDDLETCRIRRTIVHGVPAEEIAAREQKWPDTGFARNSVKCANVTAADFDVEYSGKQPVIGVSDGSLLTDFLQLSADDEDVLRIAVVERHGKNGHIGHGLVHGFGLKRGALASSVGHDSHNICVVGTNPEDMAAAVNALRESQGGFVSVCDGVVTSLLPLPIAGLVSDQPAEVITQQLIAGEDTARELGCPLLAPFLQLAFIPLPVIPHLKLTDQGLVDVDAFKLI